MVELVAGIYVLTDSTTAYFGHLMLTGAQLKFSLSKTVSPLEPRRLQSAIQTEAHLSTIIPMSKDRMRTDDINSGPGHDLIPFFEIMTDVFSFFCLLMLVKISSKMEILSRNHFSLILDGIMLRQIAAAARWYPEIPAFRNLRVCFAWPRPSRKPHEHCSLSIKRESRK